jgi:hypothetical protein
VTGCASPELGAHVLLKFLNRSGFELGSTVVTLSHLLHTSTEEVHATQFNSVSLFIFIFSARSACDDVCSEHIRSPKTATVTIGASFHTVMYPDCAHFMSSRVTQVAISSGGQQRGTISGKFSLKYLPSLVSGEST